LNCDWLFLISDFYKICKGTYVPPAYTENIMVWPYRWQYPPLSHNQALSHPHTGNKRTRCELLSYRSPTNRKDMLDQYTGPRSIFLYKHDNLKRITVRQLIKLSLVCKILNRFAAPQSQNKLYTKSARWRTQILH